MHCGCVSTSSLLYIWLLCEMTIKVQKGIFLLPLSEIFVESWISSPLITQPISPAFETALPLPIYINSSNSSSNNKYSLSSSPSTFNTAIYNLLLNYFFYPVFRNATVGRAHGAGLDERETFIRGKGAPTNNYLSNACPLLLSRRSIPTALDHLSFLHFSCLIKGGICHFYWYLPFSHFGFSERVTGWVTSLWGDCRNAYNFLGLFLYFQLSYLGFFR